MQTFRGGCGKGYGDELTKSKSACGRIGATWTGMYAKPIAIVDGLGEMPFGGAALASPFMRSEGIPWNRSFSGFILMDFEGVVEAIVV